MRAATTHAEERSPAHSVSAPVFQIISATTVAPTSKKTSRVVRLTSERHATAAGVGAVRRFEYLRHASNILQASGLVPAFESIGKSMEETREPAIVARLVHLR